MSQAFITSGNNGKPLGHIRYQNVIANSHIKSLEEGSELFDFTTHADKDFSKFIEGNNRVIIPSEDGDFLEFIIYEVQEDRINRQLEVYSYASYAELTTAKSIAPHTTAELTPEAHGNAALLGTGWRMRNVAFKGTKKITFDEYTNPFAYLKKVKSTFDLELDFVIEHKDGEIVGRYVDMVEQVGKWRGRRVEFGKDLMGLRRIENTEQIVTALKVIGPVKEDGTRLEVLVEDKDALQRWGRDGKHIIKEYEPQFGFEENATEASLIELGKQELAKRVKAIVTYEGTIADLENVPGLENKKIRFGDTIQIKDASYQPALYLDARIFYQDRDIKQQDQKQVRLGDFTEYSEEEVNEVWKSLQEQLNLKPSMSDIKEVTYTKQEVDNKDQSTFEDSTIFTEQYAEKKIPKQPTAPTSPIEGDQWIDTSSNPIALKIFNGTEWQTVEGPQGVPGAPGEDGRTTYTHTAYANSADGTVDFDISDPTGKAYLGTCTDFNIDDSTNPADYNWQKVKGDPGPQGVQGPPGEDGQPTYTWIRYADDVNGNGMSNFPDGKTYIGVAPNKSTPTESTNPLHYTWSKFVGPKGDKGNTGSQGPVGPEGPQGPNIVDTNTSFGVNWLVAEYIKSLNGLNVNDQFKVDQNGEVSLGNNKVILNSSGIEILDGNFTLKDSATGAIQTAMFKPNIVFDHSFESIVADYSLAPAFGTNGPTVWHTITTADNIYTGWGKTGYPRILSVYQTDMSKLNALFGYKSILVRNTDYLYQRIHVLANTDYTFTIHARAHPDAAPGNVRFLVEFLDENYAAVGSSQHVDPVTPVAYKTQRYNFSFTVPANATHIQISPRTTDNNWIMIDGVQIVEGTVATPYAPDDNFANFIYGFVKAENIRSASAQIDHIYTENWIRPPLSNGWQHYGGLNGELRYRKDAMGRTTITGVIKDGVVGTYTAAFTLPAGYRPTERLIFESGKNRIDVDTNGVVSVVNGSNSYVSFEGISFFTDSGVIA